MIDFGLVGEYLDKNGVHIQQTPWTFTGTPLTGSISALEGNNHSRRDDLESLGYCFMFTVNPNEVPWRNDLEIPPILQKIREFRDT